MMQEYLTFEVMFAVGRDGYTVNASTPQSEAKATFSEAELAAAQTQAAPFYDRIMTPAQTRQLGKVLFQLLFREQVRDLYQRLRAAMDQGKAMRLKLIIGNDEPELIAIGVLPWELLFDPQEDDFLALLRVSVVRYLPHLSPSSATTVGLPLRVLLTAASSDRPVNVQKEFQTIRQALAELGNRVEVIEEPHLTFDVLVQRIKQDIHIWHFLGHGTYDQDEEEQGLLFEDGEGRSAVVGARSLRQILEASSVRLAVLNACDSARLDRDILALAPTLMRARIPAVLAMQIEVEEPVARAFAQTLYTSIGSGDPIDHAVNAARIVVRQRTKTSDWAIPVVYTRAADGKLFEVKQSQAATPSSTAANPPTNASGGITVNITGNNLSSGSSITTGDIGGAGGSSSTNSAASSSLRQQQLEAKMTELTQLLRVYHQNKVTSATYGINAPPHIIIALQDDRKRGEQLIAEIRQLGGQVDDVLW